MTTRKKIKPMKATKPAAKVTPIRRTVPAPVAAPAERPAAPQQPPAAEPQHPLAAEPPAASPTGDAGLDALDAAMREEQQRLAENNNLLAEEIGAAESAQIRERLDGKAQADIEAKKLEAVAAGAHGIVAVVSWGAEKLTGPDYALLPEEKIAIADSLVPALMQANAEPPAWYVENKPWIDAAGVVAVTVFGVMQRAEAAQAARQAADKQTGAAGADSSAATA